MQRRRAGQRIQNLDEGPIDLDEQEELIELIRTENYATNRQVINIFTVLFLIPIPVFIHTSYFKQNGNSIKSFLSIIVFIYSTINIRYDNASIRIDNESLDFLNNSVIFNLINLSIASYVLFTKVYLNWSGLSKLEMLYILPMVSATSSSLLKYWMSQLNSDISNLSRLKYKFKSV